jgi:hypothetical protein
VGRAVSLKPDLFEGCRFDFTRPLNQKFSLQHSLFMGSIEVPSQGTQTFKMPAASYEFGANLIDQKVHLYRIVAAATSPPRPHSSVLHRQPKSCNVSWGNSRSFLRRQRQSSVPFLEDCRVRRQSRLNYGPVALVPYVRGVGSVRTSRSLRLCAA